MSWTTSATAVEVSGALVGALGELSNINADNEVSVTKDGKFLYKYRYANLADALEMVRPILAKHDLAVLQSVSIPDAGGGVLVETRILHKSGEWIEPASLLMNSGRGAQDVGSAITYGRRYALLACLGLAAAEDDDDGARATQSTSQREEQSTPSPTTRPSTPPKPVTPPVEPRSEDERYIRQIIAGLPGEFIRDVQRAFKEKFGPLKDLDLDRHGEALTWTTEVIAQIEAHLAGGGGTLGATTVADLVADATKKFAPVPEGQPEPVEGFTRDGTNGGGTEGTPANPTEMTPDEEFEASKLEPAEPATKNQLTSIKSLFRGNKTSVSDQIQMVSTLIERPITNLEQLTSAEAELLKKIL